MAKCLMRAMVAAAACAAAGCSGSTAAQGNGDGPHGGVLIALPGDAGFAEVYSEEVATAAKGQRRGRVPKAVVAYFLGPDKKTALSPGPTEVALKFVGADAAPPITLGPAPDPKDPAGSGRFASKVGDYDLGGRAAELSADLGGTKVVREFHGPR